MTPDRLLTPCDAVLPHLEPWFDREIDDPRLAATIETHLRNCPDCRADIEAMRLLREGLRSIPRTTAAAALYESLESTLTPRPDAPGDRNVSIAHSITPRSRSASPPWPSSFWAPSGACKRAKPPACASRPRSRGPIRHR